MITGLALMCLLEDPTTCVAMSSATIYSTESACYNDVGSAADFAATLGSFVVDFKCVHWGEPV